VSVSREYPQKVTLIRILDVMEEAFREKWGEGTIKCIIVVGRRVVGTLIALVAHWDEERISSSFAGKWLKSS
jgi:hypothetical protein